MKPDIHPAYGPTTVSCSCGNIFHHPQHRQERRHSRRGVQRVPPFYTGKQKILDSGGRVARFEKRFGKKAASK